ncbi:MAG TPA: LamG-like jellyroll fold domain-containing protein [Acidimicrobiales bacterium]|nr:LamG-like jellyroll fold domain-containing protein [Acidimicrobiales bacterium]
MRLRRRARITFGAVAVLCAVALPGRGPAAAAPAGTPHLPDLQSVIPLDQMSITRDTTGRVFRYTHVVANFGDGPLEIQPSYDPATDSAVGVQRIYSHDGSGGWSIAEQKPIVGRFVYHAVHGHYHYPLAEFGLFAVQPDGSIGAPVVMSPKVGFCIADSAQFDGSLPHVGAFAYSGGACLDPRATLGISVGYGDIYDHRDDGQSIPAEGLADGTYWFRSVADPDNFLAEKDESNNITDVLVQVTGDQVTVLSGEQHPTSTPPTVALTAPTGGAVSGTTTLEATASDAAGITGVELLLDGAPLGPPDTTAPYTLDWDTTTAADGGHTLAARATNGRGARGTTPARQIVVTNGGPGSPLTTDAVRFADGRGTVTTPGLSTATADELVVAFVAADGPTGGGQTATVSGGGLTWTLTRRTNSRLGTSEVWTARAGGVLTDARFTSTLGSGTFDQSLTVVTFAGAAGIGATGGFSAATGAPTALLTTTADGSWVHAVGNDWDGAAARTLADDQEMVHEWVDSDVGDTFWAQRTAAATRGVGVPVVVGATAPTNHQWNLSAVEVLPGTPLPPGPRISDVVVLDRTSSSARVTWTTDLPATTQVEYGETSSYGWSTTLDPALATSHSAPIAGLQPETTYHYRVVSTDADGNTVRSPDYLFTTAGVSTLSCHFLTPEDGATVSGTVPVSVDASSTASVSGVQFKVDDAPLGAEDTSPPYSVSWDTRTVPNGQHVLTAYVHDPTGNSLTSAPITVTVDNTAPPAPPGRVASFGFDEGSGTIAGDRSGSGNDGTVSGALWTTGRVGGALSFDGSGDLVTVPDTPSLDLTGGMTIDAWVRPAGPATWSTVVLKERSSGLSYGLYGADGDGNPAGYARIGGDREVAGPSAAPPGVWTHLAVTYDGAALRLYVNGALVRSTSRTGTIATSNDPLAIGGNSAWGEWFTGEIDEVNIYNRALTAAEVAQDMNATG